MGYSRQEHWIGLPFPSPADLPNLGIKPLSHALAGTFFTTVHVCVFIFLATTHVHSCIHSVHNNKIDIIIEKGRVLSINLQAQSKYFADT